MGSNSHFGRAFDDDLPSPITAIWAQIEDMVGTLDHIEVVLDDHHRVSLFDELLKGLQEDRHIVGMESNRGFVEKVQDILVFLMDEVVRQFDPLELTPGERRCGLAQS